MLQLPRVTIDPSLPYTVTRAEQCKFLFCVSVVTCGFLQCLSTMKMHWLTLPLRAIMLMA